MQPIAGISESYKYDPIGRLTNSTTKTGSTNTNLWYMYDPIGNRVAQGLNGTATGGHWQMTVYNYNLNNNELTSSTINAVTTQYGYDRNGNLLTKNIGTSTHWTYTWNVQGQPLKAANDTGAQGYYAYDGFGRRVESKENSYYYFYGYLGTETLGETGTFGPDNDYVYANGMRIAMVNDATGLHPSVIYYHNDVLGSTRLVTSSSKQVLFSDSYQPYGKDNSSTGTQTYKYTGKPVSLTTGLYYDYQRWYDPSVGRFISQDPLGGDLSSPQGLNLYAYVRNNPISRVDHAGLTDEGAEHSCSEDQSCGVTVPGGGDGDPSVKGGTTWGGLEGASNEIQSNAMESSTVETTTIEPSITELSTSSNVQIQITDVSRAGFEEAQSEGVFGNQPTPLAQGNYAHMVRGSGQAPRAIVPGSFPDQWDPNGFQEIKPYHEGVNPLEEYGPVLDRYSGDFSNRFGYYPPVVTLILYRYV